MSNYEPVCTREPRHMTDDEKLRADPKLLYCVACGRGRAFLTRDGHCPPESP